MWQAAGEEPYLGLFFFGSSNINSIWLFSAVYVLAGLVAASLQQDTVASVPGLAGRDYPALAAVPRTRFTCRGQVGDTCTV